MLAIVNAVGLILIAVSWFGASGSTNLGTQVSWLNAGVAGLLVTGVANALWLLSGLRAVGERRSVLFPAVPPRHLIAPDSEAREDATPDPQLVAGPRMTLYHRPDCPLAVGKPVETAGPRSHEAAGRRPCAICLRIDGNFDPREATTT